MVAFNVGIVSVLARAGGVRGAFGVVALASIGPVIAVLLLGVLLGEAADYERLHALWFTVSTAFL